MMNSLREHDAGLRPDDSAHCAVIYCPMAV